MTAPLALPLFVDGVAAYTATGQRLFGWRCSTEQKKYITQAINNHERMASAIADLVRAEDDCLTVSGVAYYAACGARIEALENLRNIHNELNPKE